MQSRGARIGVVVVAVAVVIVLFFVLREDDGDSGSTTSVAEQTTTEPADGTPVQPNQEPKPEPQPDVVKAEIEVEGGQPVGGVQEIELGAGERAEILVTSSDTTEEVHLHGYDLSADLAPGEPAKLAFEADIEGVFEVELEESVTPIAEVTVE